MCSYSSTNNSARVHSGLSQLKIDFDLALANNQRPLTACVAPTNVQIHAG